MIGQHRYGSRYTTRHLHTGEKIFLKYKADKARDEDRQINRKNKSNNVTQGNIDTADLQTFREDGPDPAENQLIQIKISQAA